MRRLRLSLGIIGAILLIAGATYAVKYDFLQLKWGAVAEGELYRSRELSEEQLREKVEQYGIKTIVNLHQEPGADLTIVEEKGLTYVPLPTDQVPPDAVVDSFLSVMDNPENHPVLVHCYHGIGRTGLMSAVYRIEYDDWTVDDAIDEASWFALGGSFRQGSPKEEYLRQYVPRAQRVQPAEEPVLSSE